MKIKLLVIFILSVSLSYGQTLTGGPGGTLNAPQAKDQLILVSSVPTAQGPVNLNCGVTFFGVSTYQWTWYCSGGVVQLNNVVIGYTSDSVMTYRCSGGGRDSVTKCAHVLSGTWYDLNGVSYPYTVKSGKGAISPVVSLTL